MTGETKVTIGILLVTGAVLAGLVWWGGRQTTLDKNLPAALAKQVAEQPDQFPVGELVNEGDYATGRADAVVTLVEFSDFQCPYCQEAHPQITALRPLFTDEQLRLVYRHLPLVEIGHTLAFPAAQAAQAATKQGKGGEYIDAIFAKKDELGDALFQQLAADLGLNIDQFNADLAADQTAWQAWRARQLFAQTGRKLSTPTIVINGTDYTGARTTEALQAYINNLFIKS